MKKLTKIALLVVVALLALVVAACGPVEHQHQAVAEWSSDGTNHWHACTSADCTEKLDMAACSGGSATCQHKAVCSVCGAEYGELGAHVYDKEVAKEDYLKSAATHEAAAVYYKSCECGAKGTETFTSGEPVAHAFDKEVVAADYLKSAATCTDAAVYYKSCECGAKGTDTFTDGDALGHNWVDDAENSVAASWTEAGVHAEKCNNAGCTETRTEPIECLARTLVIDDGDNVVAAWEVKKYDNGWAETKATASKTDGASHDQSNATTFNLWHNSLSFRYSAAFDAQGKDYNLLAADIKGDGIAKVKIRLRNSNTGVYATYTMPVALQSGWYHYELPLSGDGWALEGASSAEAKHFDTFELIFNTNTSNGASATLVVDNIVIKNVETPEMKMEALTPVKTGPLLTLDFEDGAGSGNYTNAAWTQEQYNSDGWGTLSGQMNSRSKDGSKVVNFVCSKGMTRRFTYAIGETLASVNYISADLGNYYDPKQDIKYKVILIDASGNSKYVGGSDAWLTLSATEGLTKIEYTFSTAVTNVVSIRIVTQGTSGSQYLYADNIVLDYVA